MDIKNLNYSKESKNKDLLPESVHSRSLTPGVHVEHHIKLSQSSLYTKEDGFVDPVVIFIVSGGTTREKNYFDFLISHDYFKNKLLLVFQSKDKQGLTPKQMLSLTKTSIDEKCFYTNGELHHYIDGDRIYLVTDVDLEEDNLIELLKHEESNKYKWIISNPCLEIWLYYHYFCNPAKDFPEMASIPVEKRSQHMKTKLDIIIPGGIDTYSAYSYMQVAIKNAKSTYSENTSTKIPNLFSTQMYLLGEDITSILGESFSKLYKKSNTKIKRFLDSI